MYKHCFLIQNNLIRRVLSRLETVVHQRFHDCGFHLHQTEAFADAVSRSRSEWEMREWLDLANIFCRESIDIELQRIGEVVFVPVDRVDRNINRHSIGNPEVTKRLE